VTVPIRIHRFFSGGVCSLALLLISAGVGAGDAQHPTTRQSAPISAEQAALKRYCSGCHNSKLKSGGMSLDDLHLDRVGPHAAKWEKIVRKLRTRSMPPVGLPRPDERTYESMTSVIETGLDRAAAENVNPGRTDTFRRLNRTEYQNVVRDLLATDVDVTSLLPSDELSHGFDNITVGELSPTLLERYLSAARKISRLALGRPVRSPGGDSMVLPPDLTQEDHFEDLPLGTRGGAVLKYTFPVDAKYDIQVRLARDRNEHVEGLYRPHHVEVMLDGARVKLFTVKPPARGQDHSEVDRHLTIRVPVTAGLHTVAVTFPRQSSAVLESERQPWHAHFNMDRHPRITPALYSITVNGPYEPSGPGDTPSRRRILVCKPKQAAEEAACAQKIFSTLMRRAYRRPVTDEDVRITMKFYRDGRREEDFDAGIEMGLRSILVNPEFLFRVEQDPAGRARNPAYRISDLELASRLSFFLWSSIPDDELLDLAISGKLRNETVLAQQVRRMLADSRSKALVTNFAAQWLHLRNLSSATPDMRLFTDFDDNLRRSFKEETELFVESIMREDRSVLDLLSSNYSFLNERLAKHYGIPNIYGSRFRRVTFPSEGLRGGLLRQGSILTVTSYATRTSPVIRGKWVLDNILGSPPPPPPPDVPALKEKVGISKPMTMRERLAQHRENPACAGCHNIMDPIGFAFENYDAVGRWRTAEDGAKIDSSGGLPNGAKFDGVAGLQQALLKHPDLFATIFTEKLLTYGLGRGVDYYDAPAVRKVVKSAAANDYRFASFITGIVNSVPFQMRRSQ
jgi:Protein of unknown function (DUF1592)/Protein of unknown function (DUF1588)/Protein of unknown function (DUF1585)/Protein of unknown function (DUF1587)/Protein of unknown function (DUF1595)